MAPQFSSPRQAAAFALILLTILLLPVFLGKSILPSREQVYSSTGREIIDFPGFHQKIFEEKGDIDIAIMGSSRIGCAIDGAYLEKQLSEKLGRKAVVRTITWTWNGYDALYFVAKDLLQNRKVHMMVICDLTPETGNIAHHQTSYWFRLADNAEALSELPWTSRASFYASSILGAPRNLLGMLRSNLPEIPHKTDLLAWNHAPFDYAPQTSVSPSDVCVYSSATKSNFKITSDLIPAMQMDFVRKLGDLTKQNHTQLFFLDIPDYADRKAPFIEERMFWPDAFATSVPMAGIAPAKLFSGLSDDDILKLYHNPTHFNQNGTIFFTPLVTPSIIQIYENQIKP